ncbi:MAG: LysR family transcriptional regulator [Planctomycetia bacterium]|nr:LysR family transcriptional regulator [Planctomycetia bacterium]
MKVRASTRRYKELRFQQLRSFAETARLGSLAAAAASLGVAQPTVWAQVHALERSLSAQLIEPHGRGCRLTEAGQLLAQLAGPLVAGMDSLGRVFREQVQQVEACLTVAAPQRILVEELPEVIAEFERQHPQVRLNLLERMSGTVAEAVEKGTADLGISTEQEAGEATPWLQYEPGYELDILLICPRQHPLAKKDRVGLRDLKGYPLVNAVNGFPRREIAATLQKLGAFAAQPRRVEAVNTPVIRRYVEMGLGIGIVVGRRGQIQSRQLCEHSLSRHFGLVEVNLIWRKGVLPQPHARAFADTVKKLLAQKQPRTGS